MDKANWQEHEIERILTVVLTMADNPTSLVEWRGYDPATVLRVRKESLDLTNSEEQQGILEYIHVIRNMAEEIARAVDDDAGQTVCKMASNYQTPCSSEIVLSHIAAMTDAMYVTYAQCEELCYGMAHHSLEKDVSSPRPERLAEKMEKVQIRSQLDERTYLQMFQSKTTTSIERLMTAWMNESGSISSTQNAQLLQNIKLEVKQSCDKHMLQIAQHTLGIGNDAYNIVYANAHASIYPALLKIRDTLRSETRWMRPDATKMHEKIDEDSLQDALTFWKEMSINLLASCYDLYIASVCSTLAYMILDKCNANVVRD